MVDVVTTGKKHSKTKGRGTVAASNLCLHKGFFGTPFFANGARISQSRECDIVLLSGASTIDEFIDFSLEQKHGLAAFSQGDKDQISEVDLALEKPDLLRALLAPP